MQNIIIYPGASIELQCLLKELNIKRIFLVTGKNSFKASGAQAIIEKILSNYDISHFQDFQQNPDWKDVQKGIMYFNHSKPELILAVGGGSVIDMAKLINYYYNCDVDLINENNINNPNFKPLPCICIPTTAGSGSEATHFAVMYINNTKFSISQQKLIPNYAIIDPKLHYSQTPYQKAVSGIDALAHAIESFWSIQSTNESRLYSEIALELVWNNLPKVVHEGDHLAHLKLAIGANLAGRAINIAKTTAPHALAYGFTKYAGLPHGHAVALSLPFFYSVHNNINDKKCNDIRGEQYVKNIMNKISSIINANNNENPINDFLSKINIETNPTMLNITNDTIEKVIKNINSQRMANNPSKIDIEEIRHFFNESKINELIFITNLFEKYNIHYWLDSGTLLGIFREGKILDHDKDIDLSTWISEENKIIKLSDYLLKDYNLRVLNYNGYNFKYKFTPKNKKKIFVIDINLFIQKGKYALCPQPISRNNIISRFIWHFYHNKYQKRNWVVFDNIFFKTLFKMYTWKIPLVYYNETIYKNGFFIPKETEKYLKFRYGNWQIPQKNWSFENDDKGLSKVDIKEH